MARGRFGVAGAGLAAAAAGWTAVNRAAVHRFGLRPDPVDFSALEIPGDCRARQVTVSDGWSIRVLERGPEHGRPVVLLHGVTLSAEIWPYQLRNLADAGFRVVAVDLRGHGGSAGRGPSGAQPVNAQDDDTGTAPRTGITRMAADTAELLEILDLRRAVLVGHSLGGMVALSMMHADPAMAAGEGRVAAMALVATTAAAARRRGIPGFGQLVAVAQPVLTSAAGLAARLPGPTLPASDLAFLVARITFGEHSSPRQVYFTGEMASHVPVRVSAELLLDIIRFDVEGSLASIGVPVTVMVGDRDLMTPAAQSEDMARRIAGARLEVLPGCGHMVMLERPEVLDRAVAELAARSDAS